MKVCVVGLGYWGPNLVRNFLAQDTVSQVICVDQDPAKLKRAGQLFPAAILTDNYESVLEDKSVQAVAIATPVGSHFELAWKALDQGKHVLVEKPMTRTSEQAEKLVHKARELNLTLMVDHTFLYTSAVEKMAEVIQEGSVGDIL